jgi:Ca2+-binding EF-hand superfamily protein
MKRWWYSPALTAALALACGSVWAQQGNSDREERSDSSSQRSSRQYDDSNRYDNNSGRSSSRDNDGNYGTDRSRSSNNDESWSQSWSDWWSDWWNSDDSNNASSGNQEQRSQEGARQFIKRHDQNNDGYLSRSEMPQRMRSDFDRLDANHDGELSRSEIERHASRAARRAGSSPVEVAYIWVLDADQGNVDLQDLQQAYDLLRKIDKNGDGKVSRSELRERREHVASAWCDQCFKRMDKNHDGELSKQEAKDSTFEDDFDKIDRNSDDMLTKSEIHRFIDHQFDSDQGQYQAQRNSQDSSSNDRNTSRNRTSDDRR